MSKKEMQAILGEKGFAYNSSVDSLYIQTSWKLNAKVQLVFPKSISRLCHFSEEEANETSRQLARRNVFSRHSWENEFYVSRAREFGNKTVIEVLRQGEPDDIIDEAQQTAEMIEKTILLSTVLTMNRKQFQYALGIKPFNTNQINLTIGKDYRYIRSKQNKPPQIKGITVDERILKLFVRSPFEDLPLFSMGTTSISKRVKNAIYWITESRQEQSLAAACVKTAIALESLLMLDSSEPISKNLSERSAFILCSKLEERKKLSKIVKKFYDERSRVVHGHDNDALLHLVEAMDVMGTLLCLVMSNNMNLWKDDGDLRNWCEDRKWGKDSSDFVLPFQTRHLKKVMSIGI